jgi:hypothetical protein
MPEHPDDLDLDLPKLVPDGFDPVRFRQELLAIEERRAREEELLPVSDDADWPNNPYFGDFWDVPATEDAPHAPTPVGVPCFECELPVADGDQGFLLWSSQGPVPIHRECQLMHTSGHVFGFCANCCEGGPLQGRARRGMALELWKHVWNMDGSGD